MNRIKRLWQCCGVLCGVLISMPMVQAESSAVEQIDGSAHRLVLVRPAASALLQQKTIVQIHQDAQGYLWFVTQGALHRFDGQEIIALPAGAQSSAAKSLSNNPISSVCSDSKSNVWIATIGAGLIQLNVSSGQFASAADLGLALSDENRYVNRVICFDDAIYWLAQNAVFSWHVGDKKTEKIALTSASSHVDNLWRAGEQLWLSSGNQLFYLDRQDRIRPVETALLQGRTSAVVDNQVGGTLFFGSYGVVEQSSNRRDFKVVPLRSAPWQGQQAAEPASYVIDALVEPDGTWWIITVGSGVYERRADGREFRHQYNANDPSGFPENTVTSLLRDRVGRLWFGTLSSGFVYRAEGYRWFTVLREQERPDNHPSNNIFALLPDDNGGVWLGEEVSGLRYLNANGQIDTHSDILLAAVNRDRKEQLFSRLHVRSLLAEKDSLLVGHAQGLLRYWPKQQRADVLLKEWLGRPVARRGIVRALAKRRNGDYLIASEVVGLLIWTTQGEVRRYSSQGVAEFYLPTDHVFDVIEDPQQQIWLGTDAGLFRLRDGARAQRVAEADQSLFINSLHIDNEQQLWVGSFGGIARLQNLTAPQPRIALFGAESGLPDNVIYAITNDKFGNIWASSNRGLARLKPQAKRWQAFGRQDGLSDDEFNLHAVGNFSDGRLAFGGISGVSLIDPDQEPVLQNDDPLRIVEVQTGYGEPQVMWQQQMPALALPADASQLQLRFATPGTSQPAQQQFYFRFSDEKQWRHIGHKSLLQFDKLMPGKKQLELAWSYGDWPSRAQLTLPIEVTPLWWQRNDVRIATALLLLIVIVYQIVQRYRYLQQKLQQQKALNASDERLRLALWGSGDALWDWDCRSGQVERTGFENLLGYDSTQVQASIAWRDQLIHHDDVAQANSQLQLHLEQRTPYYEAQYRMRNAQGDWIWVVDRGRVVERDAQDKALRMAGTMRDISERRRRDDELEVLANYDSLTKLPNRTLFHDRLTRALLSAERRGLRVALLFIDLDRFKSVNDSYGHHTGDALLIAVARRLRDTVRAEDTVARLGGDEFTVVLESVAHLASISRVVDHLQQSFSHPFYADEQVLQISPSIGVSVYPDDADSPEKLLNHADMAMYAAKEQGRNATRYFESAMNDAAQRRAALSLALRKAQDAGELSVHFQPRLDVRQHRITGFEALLRWKSASLGSVSPAEFIPIAEEFGLIGSLGYWVLEQVIKQLQEWQQGPLAKLPIAVNVSIRQLFDPLLQHRIIALLKEHHLPPSLLHIEVTETVLMDNVEQAIETLQALRDRGVAICIDDFGTGYSSLGYLRRLPLDGLKVDKSFVDNMMNEKGDAVIVDTIIAMAHALRLYVVAEGVETAEQLEFLKQKGCEEIQGYLLAKPMPAADCLSFIERFRTGDLTF